MHRLPGSARIHFSTFVAFLLCQVLATLHLTGGVADSDHLQIHYGWPFPFAAEQYSQPIDDGVEYSWKWWWRLKHTKDWNSSALAGSAGCWLVASLAVAAVWQFRLSRRLVAWHLNGTDLFVVLTLACLISGRLNEVYAQNRALSQLQLLGHQTVPPGPVDSGPYSADCGFAAPLESWGWSLVPDDVQPLRVRMLSIRLPAGEESVSRQTVEQLGRLRTLRTVGLHGLPLAERDLVPLSELNRLQTLAFYGCGLSEQHLKSLRGIPNLTYLILADQSVSRSFARELGEMSHLRDLYLDHLRSSSPAADEQMTRALSRLVRQGIQIDARRERGM